MQVQNVNYWDVSEKIKEAFHVVNLSEDPIEPDEPMEHTWLPNQSRSSLGEEIFNRERRPRISIRDEVIIDTERSRLRTNFAPEIEIMKKQYGEDNVRIDWGLVRYTM